MDTSREKWVDHIKVIACVLVCLGHFFQSMIKSNILQENGLYLWFNQTIYYFHVYLFFICSGYLYQKFSNIDNFYTWKSNVFKKLIVLGVPYVTFSFATWLLKMIFASSVNGEIGGGLLEILLLKPESPYWYLYTLFFIFLITPTFKSKKTTIMWLCIAIIGKGIAIVVNGISIYAISTVLSNEVWFVLGMCMCWYSDSFLSRKKLCACLGSVTMCIFIIMSVIIYKKMSNTSLISFCMGVIASFAVIILIIGIAIEENVVMDFLAKYTMPIFLMHTLFAAPVRIILIKMGVSNAIIHIIVGIMISIAGPIVAAEVMRKTKWLEFFLYPSKFIRFSNKKSGNTNNVL